MPAKKIDKPASRRKLLIRETPADPADFGKKTSPVRERLAREVKEMPPEDRLRQAR